MLKAGYIYVLTHPSDPDLYKIGVTVLEPKKRLAQHNTQLDKAAGRIVRETGQKWEIKEYHPVPDPYWAERAFWASLPISDIPYRRGIEVEKMSWDEIQRGLDVARRAGLRSEQPPEPIPPWVHANNAIMNKRLVGRDITLLTGIKSMRSGKANFRCGNGHEWRTVPWSVAEGEGCPECGVGLRSPDEMKAMISTGIVCLLTNPTMPDFIHIGISRSSIEDLFREQPWGDWEIHRYRNTEEIKLAEETIWELLGYPLPHDREPIKIELKMAEDAMRQLHYVVQDKIISNEKRVMKAGAANNV